MIYPSIHELNLILNDTKNHHRDKSFLIEYYINERLTKSLMSYYKDLSTSVDFLDRKDNLKVLKTL